MRIVELPDMDSDLEAMARWWATTGAALQTDLNRVRDLARQYIHENGEAFGLALEPNVEWLPDAGAYYPNAIASTTVAVKLTPGTDVAKTQRMADQAFTLLTEQLPKKKADDDPDVNVTIEHKISGRVMNKLMHGMASDAERHAQIISWRINKPRLVKK